MSSKSSGSRTETALISVLPVSHFITSPCPHHHLRLSLDRPLCFQDAQPHRIRAEAVLPPLNTELTRVRTGSTCCRANGAHRRRRRASVKVFSGFLSLALIVMTNLGHTTDARMPEIIRSEFNHYTYHD